MSDKISYTIAQAVDAIGISRATLYRSIKAGEIRTFPWGGRVLIKRAEIEREIERRSGGMELARSA